MYSFYIGTDDDDVYDGSLLGTQFIWTFDGNDTLIAGSIGADMHAGPGNDYLLGGIGNDAIEDGDGNDVGFGGVGNDRMFASRGNDTMDGGSGQDLLTFQYIQIDGPEAIENPYRVFYDLNWNNKFINLGVFGVDKYISVEDITGGYGSDTFYGNSGKNTLSGREGSDKLDGRSGNDTIYGGVGKDTITGGLGQDKLCGGQYRTYSQPATFRDGVRDVFVFKSAAESKTSAPDTILYFEHGIDRINLNALNISEVTLMHSNGRTVLFADTNHGHAGYEFKISINGNVTTSDIWM